MRKLYASFIACALILAFALALPSDAFSQTCTTTGSTSPCTRSGFYYGEILPNSGCGNFTQVPGYGPGYYFRLPVLLGGCYTVSTCGAPTDLQVSAYQGASSTAFAYNDDNGPDCSGVPGSIVIVPGFTDYANIDVRQYNCQAGGTQSITVKVRQNNNLSITSASTDLCQGGTRSLTATPARVVTSPQAGSGDVGTFTGTGVSGTVFTAPTPAGSNGSYTITYTFGYCSTTQSINVFRNPTTANAGTNQTVCSSSASITGNTPTYGTGQWSIVSGPGSITAPASASTSVTGLVAGSVTTVRWTVSNGPCSPSVSTITITRDTPPTISNAGTNQNVCSTVATLGANSPTTGTGQWTLIGGSGTFTNSTTPGTQVSGLGTGPNTFVWTISNGVCPASTDTVVVFRDAQPTAALAGPNQNICDSTTSLAGNSPSVGTGTWAIVSGTGSVSSVNDPNSGVTGVQVGTSVLTWTISNGTCPPTVDTVVVTRNALPAAPTVTGTQSVCPGGSTVLTASSGASGPSFVWWDAAVGGSSLGSTALYNTPALTNTTSFWVNVTDGSTGCISPRTQVDVTVNPLPAPFIGADTNYCANDTLCLTAGGTFSGYLWSNGTGTAVNCVTSTGLIWVLVTDSNGCQNADSIMLSTRPSPVVNLGPDVSFCANATTDLGGAAAAGFTYLWSNGDTTSTTTVNTAGTFVLTVTDSTGCSASDDIATTLIPLAAASFSIDSSNCPNIAFTNSSTNANSFFWSFGNGNTTTLQNPTQNYQSAGNGTYNVSLIATSACGSDTTVIPLVISCLSVGMEDAINLDITVYPNPSNGTFKVMFRGLEDDALMRVFNAAGQQVFFRDLKGSRGEFEERVVIEAAAGMYFLRLDVNGKQYTRRIVIE